jgi:hypothetical protein
MEFEAEVWRSGSMRIRGAQASDLIRCRQLIGLSKAQVIQLLGEPDEWADDWLGYVLYRGVRVTHCGSPHRLRVQLTTGKLVSEASIVER